MRLVVLFLLSLSMTVQCKRTKDSENLVKDLEKRISRMLSLNAQRSISNIYSAISPADNYMPKLSSHNITSKSKNSLKRNLRSVKATAMNKNFYNPYPLKKSENVTFSMAKRSKDRKLGKNKKQLIKKARKAQDIENRDGAWLESKINQTAEALGIHTKSDAILAAGGTSALLYGNHKRRKNKEMKQALMINLNRSYTHKKDFSTQLDKELKGLRQLAIDIEDAGRKTTSTQENILNAIDHRMMLIEMKRG